MRQALAERLPPCYNTRALHQEPHHAMTLRERLLTVFRGATPDAVPCALDLSHWFYHRRGDPWDLTTSYTTPEEELIAYHKQAGVGFYLPNLASFYSGSYGPEVTATTAKRERAGQPEIVWRLTTPLGTIERARVWEPRTYAWGISQWGVGSEQDLRVFAAAMASRQFTPNWERWHAWDLAVGAHGLVYVSPGYSAMGHLLNYWMGVERVIYAAADCPALLHEVVDAVNESQLRLIDLLCQSPAPVILMGDNFSSDVQSPRFFTEWSRPYYAEAIRRLHRAGKKVMVHIDGRLRGAIAMIRDAGADGGDAITPTPMGDLTPAACRAEAGPDFLLSGGVSPDLWLPDVPVARFRQAVLDWLALRRASPRLIAAAGDQVPPYADESRIALMRDLVEEHGRY